MWITDSTKWDSGRVLYKYLDSKGAYLTLTNRSVKCSSPAAFNDPFDTITDIRLGFEPEEFATRVFEHLTELIVSEDEPRFEERTDLADTILHMRKMRHRRHENALVDLDSPELQIAISAALAVIRQGNNEWRQFLLTWRINCLSSQNDHLLMWAHYANMHRGAVIGFRCVPEADSCFCVAAPVIYQREIPVLATLEQWTRHITGLERMNLERKYMQMTLTKSVDWEYESEYRYMLPKQDESDSEFDIRAIDPQEIHSVYLGCRITDADRDRIVGALTSDLAHVKVFQARKSETAFAVEFEPVVTTGT